MNTPQPTDYQKRAEFATDPHARPGIFTISFPAPPVCTAFWTPSDWVTYAESKGGRWTLNPAHTQSTAAKIQLDPEHSAEHLEDFAPTGRETQGTTTHRNR